MFVQTQRPTPISIRRHQLLRLRYTLTGLRYLRGFVDGFGFRDVFKPLHYLVQPLSAAEVQLLDIGQVGRICLRPRLGGHLTVLI